MKIKILTIFPQMFDSVFASSILARAIESGHLDIECIDIRSFSKSKHKNTDDYPFGGGAGMVMMAQPIVDAITHVQSTMTRPKRIFLGPKGERFSQKKAWELSREEELILLCGHYEGVDQRALDLCIDEELSIGDYILTGGELAAMVVVDALARLIPGVLGSGDSLEEESFSDGLLEYPHYTRPREFMGFEAPAVLLEGNHKKIDEWRRQQAIKDTYRFREDLLKKATLTPKEEEYLNRLQRGQEEE